MAESRSVQVPAQRREEELFDVIALMQADIIRSEKGLSDQFKSRLQDRERLSAAFLSKVHDEENFLKLIKEHLLQLTQSFSTPTQLKKPDQLDVLNQQFNDLQELHQAWFTMKMLMQRLKAKSYPTQMMIAQHMNVIREFYGFSSLQESQLGDMNAKAYFSVEKLYKDILAINLNDKNFHEKVSEFSQAAEIFKTFGTASHSPTNSDSWSFLKRDVPISQINPQKFLNRISGAQPDKGQIDYPMGQSQKVGAEIEAIMAAEKPFSQQLSEIAEMTRLVLKNYEINYQNLKSEIKKAFKFEVDFCFEKGGFKKAYIETDPKHQANFFLKGFLEFHLEELAIAAMTLNQQAFIEKLQNYQLPTLKEKLDNLSSYLQLLFNSSYFNCQASLKNILIKEDCYRQEILEKILRDLKNLSESKVELPVAKSASRSASSKNVAESIDMKERGHFVAELIHKMREINNRVSIMQEAIHNYQKKVSGLVSDSREAIINDTTKKIKILTDEVEKYLSNYKGSTKTPEQQRQLLENLNGIIIELENAKNTYRDNVASSHGLSFFSSKQLEALNLVEKKYSTQAIVLPSLNP